MDISNNFKVLTLAQNVVLPQKINVVPESHHRYNKTVKLWKNSIN